MKKTVVATAFGHVHDEWHLSPIPDTGEFVFLSGSAGCHPDYSISDDPEERFEMLSTFLETIWLPLI